MHCQVQKYTDGPLGPAQFVLGMSEYAASQQQEGRHLAEEFLLKLEGPSAMCPGSRR